MQRPNALGIDEKETDAEAFRPAVAETNDENLRITQGGSEFDLPSDWK